MKFMFFEFFFAAEKVGGARMAGSERAAVGRGCGIVHRWPRRRPFFRSVRDLLNNVTVKLCEVVHLLKVSLRPMVMTYTSAWNVYEWIKLNKESFPLLLWIFQFSLFKTKLSSGNLHLKNFSSAKFFKWKDWRLTHYVKCF